MTEAQTPTTPPERPADGPGMSTMAIGLILILIGAALFGAQLLGIGIEDIGWPFFVIAAGVAIVVIGLAVIASRTPLGAVATLLAGLVAGGLAGTLVAGVPDGLEIGCGGEPTEVVNAEGSFATDGEVELDFSCGELVVTTQPGTEWSVEARHGGDEEPEIASNTESLRVRAEGGGFIGFTDSRQSWDVVLPTDASLSLTVDSNAASSQLDLDDADLSTLNIDANAGDVNVALPGAEVRELVVNANAGSISIDADASSAIVGSVEMNAGSLELCVPNESSVAITIEDENVTFSHNLDDRGFTRQGDTWSSGEGDPDVRLDVSGNAASFTFNPEEGCE